MPNPKFRGIAELSTSVVLTILLVAATAVLLGLGAMWTYGEMQKADHVRIQALIQGQAVLDGDVFAVQFNQPVVVESIGYGWYGGRSGQEVGVQFRDVGSSGRYFSWRLDRADYNLTNVVVKDPPQRRTEDLPLEVYPAQPRDPSRHGRPVQRHLCQSVFPTICPADTATAPGIH